MDAEGSTCCHVLFDSDERRAAGLEMVERYARSDAGRAMPAAVLEPVASEVFELDDLDAVRARWDELR